MFHHPGAVCRGIAHMNSVPRSSGIYKIVCSANGKIYVGSSKNLLKRYQDHFSALKGNYHYNAHLQRAYNKYGLSAFAFEIIELVMPWSLLDREQYWLDELKPYISQRGFNRNKLASANKTGSTPDFEVRRKLSVASRGRKQSPETIAKRFASRKGYSPSVETRQKLSAANKGKSPTDEAIKKRIDKTEKNYIAISPDGKEFHIKGLTKFCLENNLSAGNMTRVAQGYRSHYKGWKCIYERKTENKIESED